MARDPDALSISTIGGDLTITGSVTSKGEINLDGHVEGDVHCVTLVLGENSSVKGDVAANDVVIRGRLIGSIKALGVMLQSTSHVEADITHKSLAIEQGAFFDGRSLPLKNGLSTSQLTVEDSTATGPVVEKRKEKLETAFIRSLPESG